MFSRRGIESPNNYSSSLGETKDAEYGGGTTRGLIRRASAYRREGKKENRKEKKEEKRRIIGR